MPIKGLLLYVLASFAAFVLPAGPLSAQEGHALEVIDAEGLATTLSLAELEQMEQTEFATTTIWTDGSIRFSGVPVLKILEHTGTTGEVIVLSALNDYSIEMPISDLDEDAPIVATRMNGETMSIRDKGPYWVIFPFDDHPDYRTETNHARSVWQLVRLSIQP